MSEDYNIKAIETQYKGYRFRSRLEARWAVFFDEIGLDYEYEPEGFELQDGTRYLPDFYFPRYDAYAEIKPFREGAKEELEKAAKFVGKNGIKVLFIFPNIPNYAKNEGYPIFPTIYWNPLLHQTVVSYCGITGQDSMFCPIPITDREYGGESQDIHIKTWITHYDTVFNPMYEDYINTPWYFIKDDFLIFSVVDNAFSKARSARFEFKEKKG